jgi:hypothetical protein
MEQQLDCPKRLCLDTRRELQSRKYLSRQAERLEELQHYMQLVLCKVEICVRLTRWFRDTS